jgi:hypothetical protein
MPGTSSRKQALSDSTAVAQKILSCAYHPKQSLGRGIRSRRPEGRRHRPNPPVRPSSAQHVWNSFVYGIGERRIQQFWGRLPQEIGRFAEKSPDRLDESV